MTAPATDPEYLTVAEAALLLRCCPDTVRAGIRRGEVDAVRIGRLIRVPRAGLAVPAPLEDGDLADHAAVAAT